MDAQEQNILKGEVRRRSNKIVPSAFITAKDDTVEIHSISATSMILLEHLSFNLGWKRAIRNKYKFNPDIWFHKGSMFVQFVPVDRTKQLRFL